MKKILRTALFTFPFLVFSIYTFNSLEVQSSSFQPPTGRSKDPVNNGTCSSSGCHDSWAAFTLSRAIVTIGTNAGNQQPIAGFQFLPGTQYLINFSVIGSATRYGFQMTALRGSSMAGSFSLINTNNTSLQTQSGISYVGHRSASGSTSAWSYNWTAPSTGTGDVTFYTAVNKANNPSGDSNDSIFHQTYIITQAVAIPPTVVASNDTSICSGKSAQLNATVSNAQGTVTYVWSPATNLSCTNCQNPTASPTANTKYYVTATGTNGSAVDSVIVTVNQAPTAAITGVSAVCLGDSVTLVASNGSSYTWNQGLGTGSTKNVSPASNTAYSVTVSSAAGCTAVASKSVDVKQPSSETLFRSICSSGSFFFNGQNITQQGLYKDTLVNAAGCDSFVTLNLSVKSVVIDTLNKSLCDGESFVFKGIARDTTGEFRDTATALGGCDSITVLLLTVNKKPIADAGIDKTLFVGCSVGSAMLGGSPTASGGKAPYTFDWLPTTGLNFSQIANPLVSNISASTIYTVLVTDVNNCTASAQASVGLDSLNPTIVNNGTALASTKFFAQYQWLLNGEPIAGAKDSVLTLSQQEGKYSLEITNFDGCKDTSNEIPIINVSGIYTQNEIALNLYPNPVQDVLMLNTSSTSDFTIEVFDVNGIRVKELRTFANSNEVKIDVVDLAKGLYILKLQNKSQAVVRRFAKQ